MELSRFFTLAEMSHSDTAVRENIPNAPAQAETGCLQALCAAVLDPLREAIARPIKVNSAYRSPLLNRRIGGAGKSQHMEGKAADIQAPGLPVLDLFKTVIRLNLPFDQLIYEAQSRSAKWVHVSYDPTRARGQIMVAEFGQDGKAKAYPSISAAAALAMSEPASRSTGLVTLTYVETADEPETDAPADDALQGNTLRSRRTKASAVKKTVPTSKTRPRAKAKATLAGGRARTAKKRVGRKSR